MKWWIIIGIEVVALLVLLYIKLNNYEIRCSKDENHYCLKFENGQKRTCDLIKSYDINDNHFDVYIPLEHIGKETVPAVDLIIARFLRTRGNDKLYMFAEDPEYEEIYRDLEKTLNIKEPEGPDEHYLFE